MPETTTMRNLTRWQQVFLIYLRRWTWLTWPDIQQVFNSYFTTSYGKHDLAQYFRVMGELGAEPFKAVTLSYDARLQYKYVFEAAQEVKRKDKIYLDTLNTPPTRPFNASEEINRAKPLIVERTRIHAERDRYVAAVAAYDAGRLDEIRAIIGPGNFSRPYAIAHIADLQRREHNLLSAPLDAPAPVPGTLVPAPCANPPRRHEANWANLVWRNIYDQDSALDCKWGEWTWRHFRGSDSGGPAGQLVEDQLISGFFLEPVPDWWVERMAEKRSVGQRLSALLPGGGKGENKGKRRSGG